MADEELKQVYIKKIQERLSNDFLSGLSLKQLCKLWFRITLKL